MLFSSSPNRTQELLPGHLLGLCAVSADSVPLGDVIKATSHHGALHNYLMVQAARTGHDLADVLANFSGSLVGHILGKWVMQPGCLEPSRLFTHLLLSAVSTPVVYLLALGPRQVDDYLIAPTGDLTLANFSFSSEDGEPDKGLQMDGAQGRSVVCGV